MAEGTLTSGRSYARSIECEGRVQRVGDRTIVRLPGDASAKLPSRGQVAADAVLNGRALTTVLEPDGRRGHWIAIDSELRRALALDEGATVALEDRADEGLARA